MHRSTLTEERLAFLFSEAAGRNHSHFGPDCDPVRDHGDQARRLLPPLLRSSGEALTLERLAGLLSEAAGRSHSHFGPDCDPVRDHGDQARRLLPLLI
jgi:hypothetical protein